MCLGARRAAINGRRTFGAEFFMQHLQWDRSSPAQTAAMASAAYDVRFAAGPAACASGGRVQFFQLIPTPPAYHARQIYAAGHFQRQQCVVRRAFVGCATESFTAALEAVWKILTLVTSQKAAGGAMGKGPYVHGMLR